MQNRGMKKQYHEVVEGTVSRGTAAKKVKHRDKRLAHVGGYPTLTKVGEKRKIKKVRGRGGNVKVKLKEELFANVATPNGVKKVKIQQVLKSNTPTLTRQNVVVKGAIIQTEIGKAIVTSRPGQDGVVNAKLLTEDAS